MHAPPVCARLKLHASGCAVPTFLDHLDLERELLGPPAIPLLVQCGGLHGGGHHRALPSAGSRSPECMPAAPHAAAYSHALWQGSKPSWAACRARRCPYLRAARVPLHTARTIHQLGLRDAQPVAPLENEQRPGAGRQRQLRCGVCSECRECLGSCWMARREHRCLTWTRLPSHLRDCGAVPKRVLIQQAVATRCDRAVGAPRRRRRSHPLASLACWATTSTT